MSSNVWFSADLHLGHHNVIGFCNRPFLDVQEMEEVMVSRFNSVLRRGDTLYLLGDIAWTGYDWMQFMRRLNTENVHIVFGNHDKQKDAIAKYSKFIKSWADIKVVKIDGYKIALCHYAMRSWPSRAKGAFHCYGHSHGTLPGVGRSMDVGCDTNNFFPWLWEDIRDELKDKPIYESDVEVIRD